MSNPILTVIPFCEKDANNANRLLVWITELGKSKSYPALLAADALVPVDTVLALKAEAARIFSHADAIRIQVPPDRQGWGPGTKFMFEHVANQVQQCYKLPWLWLEPDCVPVCEYWLDELAHGYERAPKRFMGTRCVPEKGPPHMAGPGIYPPDAYSGIKDFLPTNAHFDLAIAPYVLPRMTETPLIQHFWGKPDLAPTFKEGNHSESDAENLLPLSFIKPETVLFHRNNDGTLMGCLRERRTRATVEKIEPPCAVTAVEDPVPDDSPLLASTLHAEAPAAKPSKQKAR